MISGSVASCVVVAVARPPCVGHGVRKRTPRKASRRKWWREA